MNAKAQTVSTDAIVAIALFMLVLIFFFSISNKDGDKRTVDWLNFENEKLLSSLSGVRNSTQPFLFGNKVNENAILFLANLTYPHLKDYFGVGADFCIHFEDEKGYLINTSGEATGLGSSLVRVAEVPCGVRSPEESSP